MTIRDLADLLLYARRYAAMLQYYNLNNVTDGDWVAFIEKDISTLVAIVANHDVDAELEAFNAHMEAVACATDVAGVTEALHDLFVFMHGIADTLAEWHRASLPELSLHQTLSRLFSSRNHGWF